jgi:hypothetical protein
VKINQDIVNDVIYKYAKFYYEILCIVGYTKIRKFDKIYRFEIYILRSRCFSFLCSPKYKVFEQDVLHIGGINSWLHANIFSNFLKTQKYDFQFFFFEKTRSLVPMCTKSLLLLWLEKDGVRKYHLVKWEIVCMPQDQGGLGVVDLRVMNFCLLCKWLWKLETTDGLWQQMIRAKYLKNKPLSQRVSKPSDSHFWQGVLKTAGTFTRCSRRLVGNGLRTLFWEDL